MEINFALLCKTWLCYVFWVCSLRTEPYQELFLLFGVSPFLSHTLFLHKGERGKLADMQPKATQGQLLYNPFLSHRALSLCLHY